MIRVVTWLEFSAIMLIILYSTVGRVVVAWVKE